MVLAMATANAGKAKDDDVDDDDAAEVKEENAEDEAEMYPFLSILPVKGELFLPLLLGGTEAGPPSDGAHTETLPDAAALLFAALSPVCRRVMAAGRLPLHGAFLLLPAAPTCPLRLPRLLCSCRRAAVTEAAPVLGAEPPSPLINVLLTFVSAASAPPRTHTLRVINVDQTAGVRFPKID